MAEERGTVVIKTDSKIINMLNANSDATAFLKALCQHGNINFEPIDGLNSSIETLEIKEGYAKFDFDCSEWKSFSELFVENAKNIEWYARIYDEYGTTDFYLLNNHGKRIHFAFYQGGDMCEIDGYEEEVMEKVNNWISELPADVKNHFPDFVDVDDIEFDGP